MILVMWENRTEAQVIDVYLLNPNIYYTIIMLGFKIVLSFPRCSDLQ